ncbi:MAG: copper chaperone [Parvicellaceae bacterium]|jgi:copper chaperone
MNINNKTGQTTLTVDNLKCGGCEKTVRKVLIDINGIHDVIVDASSGTIVIDNEDPLLIKEAINALSKAGYPPEGESNVKDVAMSYISCVKGRISK